MSDWISVEDRLSDTNRDVLAYNADIKEWLIGSIYIDGEWGPTAQGEMDCLLAVTHWMPLPFPPGGTQ